MEGLKALGGTAGLAKALHSDLKSGLDPAGQGAASVDEHRRVFGKNAYKQVEPKNLFQLAWENAQDPIILLLVAAALVGGAPVQLLQLPGFPCNHWQLHACICSIAAGSKQLDSIPGCCIPSICNDES